MFSSGLRPDPVMPMPVAHENTRLAGAHQLCVANFDLIDLLCRSSSVPFPIKGAGQHAEDTCTPHLPRIERDAPAGG